MTPLIYVASDFGFDPSLPLETLADKGLAHTHIRIVGTGFLARIPKQSQLNLDAQSNLIYQKACFERASVGGLTPSLLRVVEPNAKLQRGALIVQEIVGRAVNIETDLSALATSLAALHALPCPISAQQAPLKSPLNPLLEVMQEVEQHLAYAGHKAGNKRGYQLGSANTVGKAIERNFALVKRASEIPIQPPKRMIGFDVHPGNFIVTEQGNAVLVDLEKCRYSYAGFDLAHATQYTSTTWDTDTSAILSVAQVAHFYSTWIAALNKHSAAQTNDRSDEPWFVVLRRAMWLWSISWCLKWQTASGMSATPISHEGEDWSEARSDPQLVEHVRERVAHYLSPAAIEFFENEANELEQLLGCPI